MKVKLYRILRFKFGHWSLVIVNWSLVIGYWLLTILVIAPETASSQPAVIDQVVAVVGNHIIKKSDVEKQYLQYIAQGNTETGGLRCAILENLLLQKLLVQQAAIDSVDVSDAQVESE